MSLQTSVYPRTATQQQTSSACYFIHRLLLSFFTLHTVSSLQHLVQPKANRQRYCTLLVVIINNTALVLLVYLSTSAISSRGPGPAFVPLPCPCPQHPTHPCCCSHCNRNQGKPLADQGKPLADQGKPLADQGKPLADIDWIACSGVQGSGLECRAACGSTL